MKKTLQLAATISILSVAAFLCLLLYQANQTLKQANTTLFQTQQDLAKLSDDLHGTSQNLNAVLIQAGLTSNEVRRAAMEQRSYWNKNSQETHELLTNLNSTVVDVDKIAVINGTKLFENQGEVGENLASLNHALVHIGNVADDLDRGVNHVNQTLYSVDPYLTSTMQNLNVTSANISSATDSIARASKDVETKVHQLTKPASFAKSVGMTILDVGAKLGSVFAGFVK